MGYHYTVYDISEWSYRLGFTVFNNAVVKESKMLGKMWGNPSLVACEWQGELFPKRRLVVMFCGIAFQEFTFFSKLPFLTTNDRRLAYAALENV